MVVKVLSIDVRDGKFRDFLKLYERYDKALKSAPAAWAMVEKNIDGSRGSFDKMVDQMAAANVQAKLREKAQERADRLTQTTAERWKAMAASSRDFLRNVAGATGQLLKWASITGVISGLVGAGGLFGIDRLAAGAAGSRRSALGLGLGIGAQSAFEANAGRLVDPRAFLESVAGARFDVTKRVGLLGAGLSQRQIDSGDTGSTSVALLRRLKQIADTTDPALFAQVLQSRRLDQFASPTDLNRLRGTSGEEFEQVIRQMTQRQGQFDLPPDVARRWQDFVTQLDNAGKGINTTLVKGLIGLEPGLAKLSDAIEKLFGALLKDGGPVERWVTQLGSALERFANYVGTEEFMDKVQTFVNGIGKIADKIGSVAGWFADSDPDLQREREERNKRVQKLRDARKNGTATAWSQLGDIFNPNAISQDQLLAMVRERERSGDSAVSPKGAVGRYQITPDTARTYGADPSRLTDPAYSEETARKILADLARRYRGNVPEILAAYNAGPGRADKYRAAGDDASVLPDETRRYVKGSEGMKVVIQDATGGSVNVSANGLKD